MLALLLAASLAVHKPDSLRLSISLYAFGAASDEITTMGKRETGMTKSTAQRIGLKAVLLPAYLVITHKASKSPHRWVRTVGKIARFGVPAMFIGGALHNIRQDTR